LQTKYGIPKPLILLGNSAGFGNWCYFWKLPTVLETTASFGNSPQFPELPALLETIPGFGNCS
jgi:hypothetical protein